MTERLLLREFTAGDAPAFEEYQADPRYAEFHAPGDAGPDARPDRARELLERFLGWAAEEPRSRFQLAIADRTDPARLLGCGGLRLAGGRRPHRRARARARAGEPGPRLRGRRPRALSSTSGSANSG